MGGNVRLAVDGKEHEDFLLRLELGGEHLGSDFLSGCTSVDLNFHLGRLINDKGERP